MNRTYTEDDMAAVLKMSGIVGGEDIDGILKKHAALTKDTMPAAGRPLTDSRLYDGGPFGFNPGEILSTVTTGGSALMNWIPSKSVKSRRTQISHLEFVTPEGFDPETTTYAEWLASLSLDDCGYGPSTVWSGFTYSQSGGSFSWSTNMMKTYEDSGLRYWEQQPTYAVRGNFAGSPLSLQSDRQWAVARLMMAAETHLDYVLKHGNASNSAMEWDGLDQILLPGYVQSRVEGPGIPHWADPYILNGSAITTVAELLTFIRRAVRVIRNRARAVNWTIIPGDMVLHMPSSMWDAVAESVAAGGMYAYTNAFGFDGSQTFGDFRTELTSVLSGGNGQGVITVDGFPVFVMPDVNTGHSTTITTTGPVTSPGVTGDVNLLTRRAGGMTLLEQQYIDWTKLDYPAVNENVRMLLNGQARTGWVTEANKCYYYYMEMAGRMVSFMQPLQARILSVTVPVLDAEEVIAGSFTSPDFLPFKSAGSLTPVL